MNLSRYILFTLRIFGKSIIDGSFCKKPFSSKGHLLKFTLFNCIHFSIENHKNIRTKNIYYEYSSGQKINQNRYKSY